MKKSTFMTSAAIIALSAGVAGAADLGSSTYEAGVSLLMPENTGFMYSSQVEAQGLGTGTSSVSTQGASFTLTGFASTSGAGAGEAALTTSGSGVYSDFTFDRTVSTYANSSGQGKVLATGEALGSIGGVGSAAGKSTQQTIEAVAAVTDVSTAGDLLTSSNSSSESAASLVGGARTTLVAGVVGTTDTFVGDTGTSVTDSQVGSAVAGLLASGDNSAIQIKAASLPSTTTGEPAVTTYANKYGTSELTGLFAENAPAGKDGITGIYGVWGSPNLNLQVENLGGGTVSLGAETGGFFTGGVSTLGKSGLNSSTSVEAIAAPAE